MDFKFLDSIILNDDELLNIRGGLSDGNFCGSGCGVNCGSGCGLNCGDGCGGTIFETKP